MNAHPSFNFDEPSFGTDPVKLARASSPATSREAAETVNTPRLEEMVLEVIKRFGTAGCIQDDVLSALPNRPYSSVTARFKALRDKDLIIRTGEKRQGKSGSMQEVMVVNV